MSARVCYVIQTHRDPEQIHRLVRTLRRGSSGTIVVQHDFGACHLDWTRLAGLPDVHLVRQSRPHVRAHFSCQAQPYLEVVDRLERMGVEYDWLVNLTGQDYPVTPVAAIEAFLGETRHDGFLRYWDVLSAASPWSRRKARARYWHRYWRLGDGAERALSVLRPATRLLPLHFYLDYGPYVGVRRLRTPFCDELRCYGGWAWFSLRRSATLYLREFLVARPDVLEHYRTTVAAEESIVQTVLVNSRRFDLVDDDLRYVDYSSAHKGSPRTLTVADLPILATGRYHWARKFDWGGDREVLDRIDREILGLEPEGGCTPPEFPQRS